MKIRATNVTAFLTGIWTALVMIGLQWSNLVFGKSNAQFVDLGVMVLLLMPPAFIFVFGVFEARATYLMSSEGLKGSGRKFVRILCWWVGAIISGLTCLLAIRLLGIHL